MSAECFAAIHLCRIRITRLDQLGNAMTGPNNAMVSDKPIQLVVTPQIQAGDDKTLVGGCDCIIAEYRGYDKLKYFTLELDTGMLEPAMLEMLIGASAIVEGGDVKGVWWPSAQTFSCATPPQPNVCFEGWQDTWLESGPAPAPNQFVHWIWPSSFWQIAAHTLANDFNQPKITGFTRGNNVFGLGPYGDLPEAVQPLGGFFFTDTEPEARCGYLTVPVT